jgi:hypothetical protein
MDHVDFLQCRILQQKKNNVFTYTFQIFVYFFLSCGTVAHRGPRQPHSWGFYIAHDDASQSVGLLWTSNQLVAVISVWQHTTLTTENHPCPQWDSNPQSQQANGRRPTPSMARPLGSACACLLEGRDFDYRWCHWNLSETFIGASLTLRRVTSLELIY